MLRYKNVDVNKSVFHYALAHSLESLIMKTTEIPLLVCQYPWFCGEQNTWFELQTAPHS